jgi:hypothetical protein
LVKETAEVIALVRREGIKCRDEVFVENGFCEYVWGKRVE